MQQLFTWVSGAVGSGSGNAYPRTEPVIATFQHELNLYSKGT